MELNEQHYNMLKACRDNGKLSFCWNEQHQHNQQAIFLLSFGYLYAENEEYLLSVFGTRELMSFDVKLTNRGIKTLKDYEDQERDLNLRVETLIANKEVVDIAKEALKLNEQTVDIVKKEKKKSLANRIWTFIIGVAGIGSFIVAIIALCMSCT